MEIDYCKESCAVVSKDYVTKYNLAFVDYFIDNDTVLYTIFRDDDDCYFACEGEC